jgi:hypothetical protein
MKIVFRKILSLIIVFIYLLVVIIPIAILCLPFSLLSHFSKLIDPKE